MTRTKKIAGWVVLLGAVGAVLIWAPVPPNEPAAVPAAGAQAARDSARVQAAPQGRFDALPSREPLAERRGELFPARTWAPPPAPASAVHAAPSAPPAPPPMPYRVAGKVVHEGGAQVVLAKGDRVVTVREGEVLEDGYRVESITAKAVTLVYVPLGVAQQLPVNVSLELNEPAGARNSAAAAPAAPEQLAGSEHRPAQLRFEGPTRIRAGDPFNVALKVTSHEAIRSAPLQLSFDADLLQAVDVRRGGFFAEGTFSYRINPSGSIFIGASGKGAVPADAEFFVITFKPVRPGATELKLSSVLLQGAAGHAIAHDQPPAFRASIVQ